ncbi:MAG: membrane protein insertion efficiency factor YidD [Ruminococcus sp.]|nr:membrane protein insertion efficiency factor YidD [Ruminococcus sp.]
MRRLLIKLIRLYQSMPIEMHKACRFYPSCSNYAIEALETHGLIKGLYLSIRRILRCNPFNKDNIVDLVPPKK